MMSAAMYRAPLKSSEMMELRWILRSSRLIYGDLGLSSYVSLLPPSVKQMRCVSVLDILMFQTKLA